MQASTEISGHTGSGLSIRDSFRYWSETEVDMLGGGVCEVTGGKYKLIQANYPNYLVIQIIQCYFKVKLIVTQTLKLSSAGAKQM